MMRRCLTHGILAAAAVVVLTALGAGVAAGCGPWLTFRAYLRRSFWQPVRYLSMQLAAAAPKPAASARYAGFSDGVAPAPLPNAVLTPLPDVGAGPAAVAAPPAAAVAPPAVPTSPPGAAPQWPGMNLEWPKLLPFGQSSNAPPAGPGGGTIDPFKRARAAQP